MIVKDAPHAPQVITKEPQVVTKEPQTVTKEKQVIAGGKRAVTAKEMPPIMTKRMPEVTSKPAPQVVSKEKKPKTTPLVSEPIRPIAHYTFKTPEGQQESVQVITHYYPNQIVHPLARADKHFDPKLMRAASIAEERAHGFAYGTLDDHAEQGEERFSVEWSADDGSVFYDILAFSRPRQWQARVARPLSRALQRKFARDSKAAMMAEIVPCIE